MKRVQRVTQIVGLILIVSFGLVSILGKGPLTPSDPEGCRDLKIATLSQPTAAMAWMWGSPAGPNDRGGFKWAMIDRENQEHFINRESIPAPGWPMPPESQGIGFNMFVKNTHVVGSAPNGIAVVYLMEYTLPSSNCDASVVWDTDLKVTFPSGICSLSGSVCTSENNGPIKIKHIMFSNPNGQMSVSGAGLGTLIQAIEDELDDTSIEEEVVLPQTTSQSFTKSVLENFDLAEGAVSKVYVGVSVSLSKFDGGWVCTGDCLHADNEPLADDGLFLVTGGTNGVIGVAMTPK